MKRASGREKGSTVAVGTDKVWKKEMIEREKRGRLINEKKKK